MATLEEEGKERERERGNRKQEGISAIFWCFPVKSENEPGKLQAPASLTGFVVSRVRDSEQLPIAR
jgi:hypothetical protein